MDRPRIGYGEQGNFLRNRNRYAPYTLPNASTSTSDSVGQQLGHLSSQPNHFQYWPQTTQYTSTLQQTRHSTMCGGQVLQQSSLQAAGSSPSLTGSPVLLPQQRPTALTYNTGYTGVASTVASPSFNSAQTPLQPSPTLERLPNQTAFSPQDTTTYDSPQQQHWPQPGGFL